MQNEWNVTRREYGMESAFFRDPNSPPILPSPFPSLLVYRRTDRLASASSRPPTGRSTGALSALRSLSVLVLPQPCVFSSVLLQRVKKNNESSYPILSYFYTKISDCLDVLFAVLAFLDRLLCTVLDYILIVSSSFNYF